MCMYKPGKEHKIDTSNANSSFSICGKILLNGTTLQENVFNAKCINLIN
jgi:hypothetical protein